MLELNQKKKNFIVKDLLDLVGAPYRTAGQRRRKLNEHANAARRTYLCGQKLTTVQEYTNQTHQYRN